MRCISITFVFLAGILTAHAQVKDPEMELELQGLRIESIDLIDQLMLTVEGVGTSSRALLEQQSIKAQMMPVRKATRPGMEMSYMLASALEFYVNLDKNYKLNLSPDFILLNLGQSGKEMTLEEAFLFLSEQGTISASVLPYDASNITNACYNTPRYRIDKYLWLFREVTVDRQKIYEVRKALTRGNPVLVQLAADDSARSVPFGEELHLSGSGEKLIPFLVVGFQEEEKLFEVMSCWGSSWANSGYAWISYADFGKAARNGFVLVPNTAN